MSGQGLIPEETITRIRESVDIVELISEYVTLKKTGDNYKGLCPFHVEQTPSFVVNPLKGIFHCFGCHIGGNVFSFLMKKEGMEFVDAAKLLAKRAGISIAVRQQSSEKEILYELHDAAVSFYQNLLWSRPGKAALEYLQKRGLKEETLRRFRIGYAPYSLSNGERVRPEWRILLEFLLNKGYSIERIRQTGLVVQKEGDNRPYDRFRGRIVFPIFDELGRAIGIGARVLDAVETGAKYINSPETTLYNKSKVLYGLQLAKEAMRAAGVIVVEGYMDAITLSQAGFPNVVAASGTAFTHDQIRLIKRYTKKLWLIFDPDIAGIQATIRGMDLLMGYGMDVRVVSLPDGLDPADFLLKRSDLEFSRLLEKAQGFSDWRFKFAIKNDDIKTTSGKKKALEHLLSFIVRITDPIERQDLIRRTAEVLGLSEAVIINELKAVKAVQGNRIQGSDQGLRPGAEEYLRNEDKGRRRVEESIIYFFLTNDDLEEKKRLVHQLSVDDFNVQVCREVFRALAELFSQQRELSLPMIVERLEQKAGDFVSRLIFQEGYRGQDINGCLKKLKEYDRDIKLKEIQRLIAEKDRDGEVSIELMRQYSDLTGKR